MRKNLLFLVPLLLPAMMLHAQQVQPLAIRQHSLQQETKRDTLAQMKMDPRLLDVLRNKRDYFNSDHMIALKTNTNNTAQSDTKSDPAMRTNRNAATVVVDINCMVTPALAKLITDDGGVLVSSAKENNIITANIPVASLQKIAASPDVKQIRLSQTPAINTNAAKPEVPNGDHAVGKTH